MTAAGVRDFHPKRHLSLPSTWFLLFYRNEGGEERKRWGEEGSKGNGKGEADMLDDDKEHEEEHSDTV